MNNRELIISYAEGKVSHEEFEAELWIRPDLWDEIQSLLPVDIADPDCPFRKYVSIQGLETNHYRVKSFLTSFSYLGLRTHGMICALVQYNYPDIICRDPIDSPEDVLDKLHLDYIGGVEVDDLIRTVLAEDKSSSKIKNTLKQLFPCASRKHPDWIQEPEWPMGVDTPMKFIRQYSVSPEEIRFCFEDVKTKETREIVQYY